MTFNTKRIAPFRQGPKHAEVLVLVVGHENPHFLSDTARSFDHFNAGSRSSYRVGFAVDADRDCAGWLADRYGDDLVYCSPKPNGWGRGILRTVAYALDHFRRNGIRFEHLITVDSDTLVVGPCLDVFAGLAAPGVSFVGRKWGGDPPHSAANPGPVEKSRRQVRHLANLFPHPWTAVDYMVAGPFMLWTAHALGFMKALGLLPGSALDEIYPFVRFPHDQVSTLVLGFEGHGFAEVGPTAMLYCGDVGGDDAWKGGLPSVRIDPYGNVPVFPPGTSVIHPIRSKNVNEGKVRSYFERLRK